MNTNLFVSHDLDWKITADMILSPWKPAGM